MSFNLWADEEFTKHGLPDRQLDCMPAITIYDDKFAVAAVFGNGKTKSGELTRLIVAAPELLKFIQQIPNYLDCCESGENGVNLCLHRECEIVRAARNLAAKATGK